MIEPTTYLDGRVLLYPGDCREVLRAFPDNHFDSVVTDPPYALVSITKRFGATALSDETQTSDRSRNGSDGYARLAKGFMGKAWDNGDAAFAVEFWAEVLRVLKPGAHVAAFGGTRTYHRLACAIEDAGFEIRDQIAWAYGSGFPKSHDVSKGIDKAAGAEREVVAIGAAVKRMIPGADQNKDGWEKTNGREFTPTVTRAATEAAQVWEGWGTALKPAWEPIVLARKSLSEPTVAANVLRWGTGALNIAATRIATDPAVDDPRLGGNGEWSTGAMAKSAYGKFAGDIVSSSPLGRWPANIVHDGSPEVLAGFPDSAGQNGVVDGQTSGREVYGEYGARPRAEPRGDSGSAARFFYTAKADADDRIGSKHPTVKPVDLMQYLTRLITPPRGLTLDPFAGTGTTGEAAWREGFSAVLVEREAEYVADVARRMQYALGGQNERRHAIIKAKGKVESAGPLFDEASE